MSGTSGLISGGWITDPYSVTITVAPLASDRLTVVIKDDRLTAIVKDDRLTAVVKSLKATACIQEH